RDRSRDSGTSSSPAHPAPCGPAIRRRPTTPNGPTRSRRDGAARPAVDDGVWACRHGIERPANRPAHAGPAFGAPPVLMPTGAAHGRPHRLTAAPDAPENGRAARG